MKEAHPTKTRANAAYVKFRGRKKKKRNSRTEKVRDIMGHHIRGMLYKVIWTVSLVLRLSDMNNSSVLWGSASPGSRLSTDPHLFHMSLNLAVLQWSSCYAGLIDFRGSEGRSTMQFWGRNPRPYQCDLQDRWYHWFHKTYNPLLQHSATVVFFFGISLEQHSYDRYS